ncbi:MAG: hypothetical protein FD126_1295 [Elusimicrobia bacterium]|nr:MAG: hypothetical protein FD126_1295 [Elusimicrobiota bacterium]
MARLTLSTDEGEREDPDQGALDGALARLAAEPESYVLLASEAGEYLQATRSAGQLSLERQEGSARYGWDGVPAPADLASAFAGFLGGGPAWREDPRWKRTTDEDSAREHRVALLSVLRAAPLKVPQSPDGSLWASTNGEVTALLAFASEEALRETCAGAGVLTLDAEELLRRFLTAPHQVLFVEAGGDWVSVDKAEAQSLLDVSA